MGNDTIVTRLRRNAAAMPAKPFCIFHDGPEITWEELLGRSNDYAAAYASKGLGRGDLALLIFKHSPEMIYAFVGAMLAGVVPSFMPYRTPKQDPDIYWASHKALFERLQPAIVVTYRDNLVPVRAAVAGSACQLLIDDEVGVARDWITCEAFDHDTAFLQHSSGTTALKKGVMLSHRAVLNQIDAYAPTIELDADSVIASWLPLYHDMGLIACFIAPLTLGSTVVMMDAIEWSARPAILLDAIDKYAATHSWLPNFSFLHLTRVPADRSWDLSSLRALVNCSEPCKPLAFEAFRERFKVNHSVLRVSYAMAENVFAVTQTRGAARAVSVDPTAFEEGRAVTAENGKRLLSCGPVIPGVECIIVNDRREPMSDGVIGEIAVSGTSLFSGYYRLPEKTAERLSQGWYYTGDLGFFRDGELFITGRKDDLMIVYGRNYYAHDVEEVANRTPGVIPGRSVAFAKDNDRSSTKDAILLVERSGGMETDADIVRHLKQAVLNEMGLVLASVGVCAPGSLVKTTSGKISRDLNRRRYLETR